MNASLRSALAGFGRFVRAPSLGRSVAALLALAIVLLMVVNLLTFLMIRRTAAFNEEVTRSHDVRMAAKDTLLLSVDAETGQRGFLLTGRQEYLEPYDAAVTGLPERMDELIRLTREDPDVSGRVDHLRELSLQRIDLIDRTLYLARVGRIGEAVQILRGGAGKVLMDQMRAEVAAIDEVQATRLQARTRQSEWGSNVTVLVNALAGGLILVLAGIVAWLIRRYVIEIQDAREAVAQANQRLEDKVRDRTAGLSRANEEIQRFAYIVSHDLRAPLVNVMGYTSELEQAGRIIDRQLTLVETKAPRVLETEALTAVRDDMPEAIGFIRASTEKMDRLINAILKLSREGRRNLAPELLDIEKMIRSAADSVRHQTGTANAEIVVEPMPLLESDRLSVEQVFGNLIDNAVKYLDPARPGRIVVSGEEVADGWTVYRVADNGRGITDRDHERIFELFRRSGRQDRTGEGLGLAFVRNSVRRLGGSIDVESELGKGSTFILKFPTRLVLEETGDVA